MIRENGVVLKADKNTAVVKLEKKSECSTCGRCSFGRGKNYVKLRAKNLVGAKAGNEVVLQIQKDNRLSAAFYVYIVPLVFAAAGLLIGYFTGTEIFMFALCLVMLVFGYIIVMLIDKSLSQKKGYAPEIVEIKNEESN